MCHAMSFVILNTPYGWCPLVHPARFAPSPEDIPQVYATERARQNWLCGVPPTSFPWIDEPWVRHQLHTETLSKLESHSSMFRAWKPTFKLNVPVKGINNPSLEFETSLEELDKLQDDFGSPMARIEFIPPPGWRNHPATVRVYNYVGGWSTEFPFYSYFTPEEVKDFLSAFPLSTWKMTIDMRDVPAWIASGQNRLRKYVEHIAQRILQRDVTLLTETQQGLEYLFLDKDSALYRYLAVTALCQDTSTEFLWVPKPVACLVPKSNYRKVSSCSRQSISDFARAYKLGDELWTSDYFDAQLQAEIDARAASQSNPQVATAAASTDIQAATCTPAPSNPAPLSFEGRPFHRNMYFACDGEFLVGCVPNPGGERDTLLRNSSANTIVEFVSHIPSSRYVLLCTTTGNGSTANQKLGQGPIAQNLRELFDKYGSGEAREFNFPGPFINPFTGDSCPSTKSSSSGSLDLRRIYRLHKGSMIGLTETPQLPPSSLAQILALFSLKKVS